MMLATLFSLALVASTFALPKTNRSSCDISKATISFPSEQSALVTPMANASFIAVAIGTQNYTCSSAGTYTNVGAVAELFDMSCLYNTPMYSSISSDAYKLWKMAPSTLSPEKLINLLQHIKGARVLGQHYYITNPISGVGVSPKWDFTSQGAYAGHGDAFVVAAKSAGIAAPNGANDVDWVYLKSIRGGLASDIYRVDTRGGQPPASCMPGTRAITVKYSAMYWLFGGSVRK